MLVGRDQKIWILQGVFSRLTSIPLVLMLLLKLLLLLQLRLWCLEDVTPLMPSFWSGELSG